MLPNFDFCYILYIKVVKNPSFTKIWMKIKNAQSMYHVIAVNHKHMYAFAHLVLIASRNL